MCVCVQEEVKNKVIKDLCNTDTMDAMEVNTEDRQSYIDRCKEIVTEDITWIHDNASDQASLMVTVK